MPAVSVPNRRMGKPDLPQQQKDCRGGHHPFGGQRQGQQRCGEQGRRQDRDGKKQPHEPLEQPLKPGREKGCQGAPEKENCQIEEKIAQLRLLFVVVKGQDGSGQRGKDDERHQLQMAADPGRPGGFESLSVRCPRKERENAD